MYPALYTNAKYTYQIVDFFFILSQDKSSVSLDIIYYYCLQLCAQFEILILRLWKTVNNINFYKLTFIIQTYKMSHCASRKKTNKTGVFREAVIPPGYPSKGFTKFGPWSNWIKRIWTDSTGSIAANVSSSQTAIDVAAIDTSMAVDVTAPVRKSARNFCC